MEDDIEELVSYLTPREENESIKTYQNTTAITCPACDKAFDDLVVCKHEFTSLNLTLPLDFCVGTLDDGSPILFTHKKEAET